MYVPPMRDAADDPSLNSPLPQPVPAAELEVARAVARRSGRPVFGVVDPDTGRRRLAGEPPDDIAEVAYLVDRRGGVRWGPAGRAEVSAAGASLVTDPARVAPAELGVARDVALAAGATVFVADAPRGYEADDDEDDDGSGRRRGRASRRDVGRAAEGPVFLFAPPEDGSLRYAVRPTGELLLGGAAAAEPPRRVRDAGWTARAGAAIRDLRRFRERGAGLAALTTVAAREWARIERLVPARERDALRPGGVVGRPGREVAGLVAAAAERELGRWREEAGRLLA